MEKIFKKIILFSCIIHLYSNTNKLYLNNKLHIYLLNEEKHDRQHVLRLFTLIIIK